MTRQQFGQGSKHRDRPRTVIVPSGTSPRAGRVRRLILIALLVSGAAILAFAAQKKAPPPLEPSLQVTESNGFVTPQNPPNKENPPPSGGGDAQVWAAQRAAAREAEASRDFARAEPHYAAAAREARGFPAGDQRTIESLTEWARLLLGQGHFVKAQRIFEEIVSLLDAQRAANPLAVAGALSLVGEAASSGNQPDAALKALERSRAIYESRLGAYHPAVAETLRALAKVHLQQQRYSDAEALFRKALEIALALKTDAVISDEAAPRSVRNPDYLMAAAILHGLGLLYDEQGREEDAEQYYRKALTTLEPHVGSAAESVARVQANLGELYARQKRFDIAEELLKKALATREKALGEEHPLVADTLETLAALYRAKQDRDSSEAFSRRAELIRQRSN